ncbi:Ubl3 protein, putative [Brugia malayi]|uniref:Ubl3 protein, putative n=1 Tax=Brugia malayi TaxID=6279 RepID=A0A4E9FD12_BRUMA|nr:Ubl3 protein, putative [Brugia malayi]VIO92648.1 Ubl3 protein, putative [Brugia malayi]
MAMPPTSAAGKFDHDSSSVDTINLRLILVSGKTKEFQLASNSSALDITQYVFDHWPDDNLKKMKRNTCCRCCPS